METIKFILDIIEVILIIGITPLMVVSCIWMAIVTCGMIKDEIKEQKEKKNESTRNRKNQ